jgi:hypothetical protein
MLVLMVLPLFLENLFKLGAQPYDPSRMILRKNLHYVDYAK